MSKRLGCECCKYHGTEDAYRNEPIVDNETVHAILLYDYGIAVYLKDNLSKCWGIKAIIPISCCPRCGRDLDQT